MVKWHLSACACSPSLGLFLPNYLIVGPICHGYEAEAPQSQLYPMPPPNATVIYRPRICDIDRLQIYHLRIRCPNDTVIGNPHQPPERAGLTGGIEQERKKRVRVVLFLCVVASRPFFRALAHYQKT
uniref:Secreted protein n=1 Tax=Panagrellus redivivus TaxID=6233 RepID=A0A7E4UWR9_PANRE